MTVTQQQRDELAAQIAQATIKVKYEGRETERAALNEQRRLLAWMDSELAAQQTGGQETQSFGSFDRS